VTSFFEQWLIDNWRKDFGGDRPGRISIVKTASSGAGLPAKERESKVFLLAFHGKSSRPFAVAKIPRFAHAAPKLKKEHDTLSAMHAESRLGAAFLRTVPAPLYFGPIGPETVSVQSALHGRLHRASAKPGAATSRDCARRFDMARQWTRSFGAFANCGEAEITGGTIVSWFIQPLDVFGRAARMAGVAADPLVEKIFHEAEALQGTRLPLARQHGDFTVSNVSFDGGECRVLDFEHYGAEKNPLFDLMWLARSLWSGAYGAAWVRDPVAANALGESAGQILGQNAGAARILYTQALLKSFVRKFMLQGAGKDAATELVPWYIEELEALRGVFAA
jgi:hypothetical protein